MVAHDPRPDVAVSRYGRLSGRIFAGVIAAGVIVAVLWSVGLPPASWFNASEQTAAQAPTQPKSSDNFSMPSHVAAASDARLHLMSTAPGRNAHEGTAQLRVDVATPETYAAGAWLENGAILREIHTDHVVLERDGQSTELYVEGVALGPNAKKIPKVNEALVSVSTMPASPIPPRLPPPPTYTDIVRAAPRFDNGAIVGFDVYPGTSAGEFSRLGLQSGDLLDSIDGVPMSSADALHAALQSMREGRSVSATIVRKGQQISVALELRRPEQEPSLASAPHSPP